MKAYCLGMPDDQGRFEKAFQNALAARLLARAAKLRAIAETEALRNRSSRLEPDSRPE